ncbi:MAG: hypothetical protein FWF44_11150, partial [Defluviitaleaceae bacterium]|nr:hypothetical protein [Defluviitaleaceae bacterium]
MGKKRLIGLAVAVLAVACAMTSTLIVRSAMSSDIVVTTIYQPGEDNSDTPDVALPAPDAGLPADNSAQNDTTTGSAVQVEPTVEPDDPGDGGDCILTDDELAELGDYFAAIDQYMNPQPENPRLRGLTPAPDPIVADADCLKTVGYDSGIFRGYTGEISFDIGSDTIRPVGLLILFDSAKMDGKYWPNFPNKSGMFGAGHAPMVLLPDDAYNPTNNPDGVHYYLERTDGSLYEIIPNAYWDGNNPT